MTIAVSTVVMPSRRFAALAGCLCLGVIGIAAALVFAPAINLAFPWRVTLALLLIAVLVWASRTVIWHGKSLRIDISEHGQITVAEDKACTNQGGQTGLNETPRQAPAGTTVVKLLPDSTIWPHLLLLRLQGDDRRTRSVLILRDCMSAEDFRCLSVACRWIAAHNGQVKR